MATINGTAGSDTLSGTSSNDTLNGLGGNDTLIGSGGTDFYDGGAGSDTLDVRATATALVIDFAAGTVSGAFSGSFAGIERVLAGDGADRITGAAGNQNISARAGNDTLAGGAGVDTLWGGGGADHFVFKESGAADADQVADFASGSDKIVLDGSVMSQLGASGNFAAGDARFWSSSSGTAHDADDRVIYNTTTRQLFYDADGNGSGAAVLIATLQSGGTLAATDVVVQGGTGGGSGGTEGNDTLRGTDGNDMLDGGGGNDSLTGDEGSDTLIGGNGNDTLNGWVSGHFSGGEEGVDSMDGGTGNDVYFIDRSSDVLADAGGIDTVVAKNMSWTLGPGFENLIINNGELEFPVNGIGNELDNVLDGRSTRLMISGGDGYRVFLDGRGGDDTIFGSAHVDTLAGGAGADVFVLDSNSSADQIADFASGIDKLRLDGEVFANVGASGNFAPGDERFFAAQGATAAHDATDRLIYNTATGDLYYDSDGTGSAAPELIASLQGAPGLGATDIDVVNGSGGGQGSGQTINGTSGADTLSGTAGDDTMNGLGGNDLFNAGSTGGADVIDGGAGRDSIEFKTRATSGIVVDYNTGMITGGSSGSIRFTSIERVVTGNFDDSLTGNSAAQNLTGQTGSDTLWGAGGLDTLWGGIGADTFIFRHMGTANAARVPDFAPGQDELHLDNSAFTAIGAAGDFSAGDARFWSSSSGAAHDANDRVIYNTSTGSLYYDADGNGSGAAQLIATFTGNPGITASDIVVI